MPENASGAHTPPNHPAAGVETTPAAGAMTTSECLAVAPGPARAASLPGVSALSAGAAKMSRATWGGRRIHRLIGQVFTPEPLADYMAGLLLRQPFTPGDIRVLDPGAGPGSLTRAVLATQSRFSEPQRSITLVESDSRFVPALIDLQHQAAGTRTRLEVQVEDFLEFSERALNQGATFTHVIMNPPYKKLSPQEPGKNLLKRMGIKVTNHYAAFLWLSIDLLAPSGRLVAVVPRSLTSGAYFGALRAHILSNTHIEQITSFDSRTLFARDSVLQDVIVVALRRHKSTEPTRFTRARITDEAVVELAELDVPRERYLLPGNAAQTLILPAPHDIELPVLGDLLIKPPYHVQAGSVVDFRHRDDIVKSPCHDSVPLISSSDLRSSSGGEHSRYLMVNDDTRRFVKPPGWYVAVKRISPPEQSPRIRAALVDGRGPRANGVAFENHVVYISKRSGPLSLDEANALRSILIDPTTEQQFRRLSSTTQVNVGDLRNLRRIKETDGHP